MVPLILITTLIVVDRLQSTRTWQHKRLMRNSHHKETVSSKAKCSVLPSDSVYHQCISSQDCTIIQFSVLLRSCYNNNPYSKLTLTHRLTNLLPTANEDEPPKIDADDEGRKGSAFLAVLNKRLAANFDFASPGKTLLFFFAVDQPIDA